MTCSTCIRWEDKHICDTVTALHLEYFGHPPATMNRTLDLKFSESDRETLRHLSDLLHLFHHRNKNQHRRSIWWRHFSTFRKQINGLLQEVALLSEIPITHTAKTKKKIRDRETQAKMSERVAFWQDVMVPKWHRTFSQLTADGRFAVLGLVLISMLSQVSRIVGITAGYEERAQEEDVRVLERFADEQWGQQVLNAEDAGEIVLRDPQADHGSAGSDSTQDHALQGAKVPVPLLSTTAAVAEGGNDPSARGISIGPKTITGSAKKPPKKKRKKGNAIDDLFGSLA